MDTQQPVVAVRHDKAEQVGRVHHGPLHIEVRAQYDLPLLEARPGANNIRRGNEQRGSTGPCKHKARPSQFWILDFGFWIFSSCAVNPKSKIQNPKSKAPQQVEGEEDYQVNLVIADCQ